MSEVELRCPVGPRRLLAKLRERGEIAHVNSDNLIELACDDCKRLWRRSDSSVALVLHRFDILGDHIEDSVERQSGR